VRRRASACKGQREENETRHFFGVRDARHSLLGVQSLEANAILSYERIAAEGTTSMWLRNPHGALNERSPKRRNRAFSYIPTRALWSPRPNASYHSRRMLAPTASVSDWLEWATGPCDWARRRALAIAVQVPWLRELIRDRDRRVPAIATIG